MTTALTLIDWASIGALWTLLSIPLAVALGRWLARGGGEWILDSWAAEDEERVA